MCFGLLVDYYVFIVRTEACVIEGSKQQIKKDKKKKRGCGQSHVYDPAHSGNEFNDHCGFACLARAAGRVSPTMEEVMQIREQIACWYESNPQIATMVARACDISVATYLEELRADLWCGLSELAAWSCLHRKRVVLLDGFDQLLWQSCAVGRKSIVLRLHCQHFTLVNTQTNCTDRRFFKMLLEKKRPCHVSEFVSVMDNLALASEHATTRGGR
eukprot:4153660-Amphidinium_carterae.1